MRNFMQTKLSEDHADKVKTKEKSSILFNELVRIGQESENLFHKEPIPILRKVAAIVARP